MSSTAGIRQRLAISELLNSQEDHDMADVLERPQTSSSSSTDVQTEASRGTNTISSASGSSTSREGSTAVRNPENVHAESANSQDAESSEKSAGSIRGKHTRMRHSDFHDAVQNIAEKTGLDVESLNVLRHNNNYSLKVKGHRLRKEDALWVAVQLARFSVFLTHLMIHEPNMIHRPNASIERLLSATREYQRETRDRITGLDEIVDDLGDMDDRFITAEVKRVYSILWDEMLLQVPKHSGKGSLRENKRKSAPP
ncbi:MAG: hypothetical protein M1831_004148 [Alyxoria varia]|nr:MAG: hypothetical protein M1831_004148 [Alyxoria varia]